MKTFPDESAFLGSIIELKVVSGNKIGLTKREYFASKASFTGNYSSNIKEAAQIAVAYADALIEELNKDK